MLIAKFPIINASGKNINKKFRNLIKFLELTILIRVIILI
tara:strand:- start:979 stop:1098 length:120 start_codon:yes stop_codon:yes gene_type:complete